MLYDYLCTNANCLYQFEELTNHNEPAPSCPQCQSATNQILSNNSAYQENDSIKYWEIRNKFVSMRNKITGKTPWRKSSDSQTD